MLTTGSITRNDSAARRTAVERRQEWLRERIRGVKRVGLTDCKIAVLWKMSAWTRYWRVRKPEGWRDLEYVEESVYDDLMAA